MCGEGGLVRLGRGDDVGSPPRVWGRPDQLRGLRRFGRFTPTCVGKAWRTSEAALVRFGSPPRVWGRRVLRVRQGAEPRFTPTCVGKAFSSRAKWYRSYGSPPRVWGRRHEDVLRQGRSRFTPTCVGKASARKQPSASGVGSPPRVWGRHSVNDLSNQPCRFTPTCVGKARADSDVPLRLPVHPHVCGEGGRSGCSSQQHVGSPPRVWGRRRVRTGSRGRTTVHPHVCGEGPLADPHRPVQRRFTPTCVGKASTPPTATTRVPGSPPRVWGRREQNSRGSLPGGSPPRVWGRRRRPSPQGCPRSVHPHVCGEGAAADRVQGVHPRFTPTCVGKATSASGRYSFEFGSPPRVWGRRRQRVRHLRQRRFTPTCVGKAPPGRPFCSTATVHPHVCGEGEVDLRPVPREVGSPPRVWGRRR